MPLRARWTFKLFQLILLDHLYSGRHLPSRHARFSSSPRGRRQARRATSLFLCLPGTSIPLQAAISCDLCTLLYFSFVIFFFMVADAVRRAPASRAFRAYLPRRHLFLFVIFSRLMYPQFLLYLLYRQHATTKLVSSQNSTISHRSSRSFCTIPATAYSLFFFFLSMRSFSFVIFSCRPSISWAACLRLYLP